MRYQLRLGLHLRDVPNRACRIDGRCANDVRIGLVPIKRGERRAEFCVLVLRTEP